MVKLSIFVKDVLLDKQKKYEKINRLKFKYKTNKNKTFITTYPLSIEYPPRLNADL